MRLRLRGSDSLSHDVTVGCLVFALLRLGAVLGRPVIRYPDSDSYLYLDFFGKTAGGRLWTVPLLYTALPGDGARVLVQTLIGVACWSALAFAVARSVRHPFVARLGAAVTLLLGLCIQVTEWDQIILSESLALSLTALLTAALLRLRLRRTPQTIAAALVVLMLWIFARQLQAIVFIPVAVVLATWVLVRARRHALVALALVALAVWSGYALTQNKGHMQFGAHDIVQMRILQTPDGAPFLAGAGMPRLEALKREAADYAATGVYLGGNSLVYQDPVWREWVDDHWTRTYAEWLVRHLGSTVRQPFNQTTLLLDGYPPYGSVRAVLPAPVQDLLWERATGAVPFWLALALLLWIVSLRNGRPGGLDLFAAASMLVCGIWFFAAWHLQVSELPRLMVPVGAAFRIAVALLILAALDRILSDRENRGSRQAA